MKKVRLNIAVIIVVSLLMSDVERIRANEIGDGSKRAKNIVIIQWAVLARYREAEKVFREEFLSQAEKCGISVNVETFNAYGDGEAFDNFLGGKEKGVLDLVVTIGNIATFKAKHIVKDKPIIFMEVLCAEELILGNVNEAKGRVSGSSVDLAYGECLKKIRERYAEVRRFGIIYTTGEEIPEAEAEKLRSAAVEQKCEIITEKLGKGFCRNEADVRMALANLSNKGEIQAIWLLDDGNTNRFLSTIVEYCDRNDMRVIGSLDIVSKGSDVGLGVDREFLSRMAAENAVKVLRGEVVCENEVWYDRAPRVIFGE